MKIIIFLISFVILGGCSTYVEEANNQQFKPLRPSFEEFERAEHLMVQYIVLALQDFFLQIEEQKKLEIFYQLP